MKLIVGLGNPGLQYERTRHNAGFMAVDRLAARHAPGTPARSRFHCLTLEATLNDTRCLLMKPLTYMNRSGIAVAEAVGFFKLTPAEDVFVLVDDVALPCGGVRIRGSGSAGGHNGLASIQQFLGSDVYARCRIGVDAPGIVPQADYVLGRFSEAQWPLVDKAIDSAAQAAEVWASRGLDAAMNKFNTRNTPAEKDRPRGSEEKPGSPPTGSKPGAAEPE